MEKTPANILCLDRIMAADNELGLSMKYIMLLRRLDDVCRSQKRARSGNEGVWRGPFDIRAAYREWARSLDQIERHHDGQRLIALTYEGLTSQPDQSCKMLSVFLDRDIDVSVYDDMSGVAAQIVLPWETWKANNFSQGIARTAGDEVLDPAELAFLGELDWETRYAELST